MIARDIEDSGCSGGACPPRWGTSTPARPTIAFTTNTGSPRFEKVRFDNATELRGAIFAVHDSVMNALYWQTQARRTRMSNTLSAGFGSSMRTWVIGSYVAIATCMTTTVSFGRSLG